MQPMRIQSTEAVEMQINDTWFTKQGRDIAIAQQLLLAGIKTRLQEPDCAALGWYWKVDPIQPHVLMYAR